MICSLKLGLEERLLGGLEGSLEKLGRLGWLERLESSKVGRSLVERVGGENGNDIDSDNDEGGSMEEGERGVAGEMVGLEEGEEERWSCWFSSITCCRSWSISCWA